MRRTLAFWLLLFGAYAATLGLDAFADADYAGDEALHLQAAEALVEPGDFDVEEEYAELGVGFALLIGPAQALAGPEGVELLMAALAALALALAYRLALHVVPDPWALGAAVAVGLSPPLLAYGSAVLPEGAAAAALAGAALLAVRLDSRPGWRPGFGCFALLGLLPWLGARFVPAGIVIGFFAARALWRARKRTLAVGSVELALLSVAFYVGLNEALYDGPTPDAAGESGESATGASSPGAYLERAYRLAALFLDREYGLLRWAPVLALAFAGLWWLWRSHRDRLARAVPQLREIELSGDVCAAALGAQLLVAAFLVPTMFGFWFPGRHLVAALPLAVPLVAWGLRHAPRVGSALAALTLAGSVWLYADLRFGDGSLVTERPDAPFGPLERLLPSFAAGGGSWAYWLAGGLAAALVALLVREARRVRPAPARRH